VRAAVADGRAAMRDYERDLRHKLEANGHRDETGVSTGD